MTEQEIAKIILQRTEYRGRDKDGNEYTIICGNQQDLIATLLSHFKGEMMGEEEIIDKVKGILPLILPEPEITARAIAFVLVGHIPKPHFTEEELEGKEAQ